MSLNICLVEPEIPHNTGAIARSCGLTKTRLHLVRPLGFSTDDKHLKRAGLDYWHLVDISYYDSFQEVLDKHPQARFFLATTKAKKAYSDVCYQDGDFLVFGSETRGLSKDILEAHPDQTVRIPMLKDYGRSLNLSVSCGILLFEALRQLNFPYME
ncbi:MAG: tRNA (cytidine(34)-2'-O)-methyltransferase [Tissierellia bacterium]|nr:tRNA (cytidine(34)-2'-O)-methyltransferase [Tissierellia bacterium]